MQLHLHPQWQGAKKRDDGGWDLDLDRWRIGDLPEDEIDDLIAAGKAWLDDVAFAKAPGRQLHGISRRQLVHSTVAAVVRSLRRHGFTVESTVVPGMRRSGHGEWSDFRSVPDLPFWRVEGDVCQPSAVRFVGGADRFGKSRAAGAVGGRAPGAEDGELPVRSELQRLLCDSLRGTRPRHRQCPQAARPRPCQARLFHDAGSDAGDDHRGLAAPV